MNFCRLCLNTSETNFYVDVFDNNLQKQEEFRKTIYYTTGVEINNSDSAFKLICDNCCQQIIKCLKFRKQSKHNDTLLKEKYGTQLSSTPESFLEISKIAHHSKLKLLRKDEGVTFTSRRDVINFMNSAFKKYGVDNLVPKSSLTETPTSSNSVRTVPSNILKKYPNLKIKVASKSKSKSLVFDSVSVFNSKGALNENKNIQQIIIKDTVIQKVSPKHSRCEPSKSSCDSNEISRKSANGSLGTLKRTHDEVFQQDDSSAEVKKVKNSPTQAETCSPGKDSGISLTCSEEVQPPSEELPSSRKRNLSSSEESTKSTITSSSADTSKSLTPSSPSKKTALTLRRSASKEDKNEISVVDNENPPQIDEDKKKLDTDSEVGSEEASKSVDQLEKTIKCDEQDVSKDSNVIVDNLPPLELQSASSDSSLEETSSDINKTKENSHDNTSNTDLIPEEAPVREDTLERESDFEKECSDFLAMLNLQPVTDTTSGAIDRDQDTFFEESSILLPCPKKSEDIFICTFCSKICDSKKGLKIHEKKHLRCTICKQKFQNVEASLQHTNKNCLPYIMNNLPSVPLVKVDSVDSIVMKYKESFDYYFEEYDVHSSFRSFDEEEEDDDSPAAPEDPNTTPIASESPMTIPPESRPLIYTVLPALAKLDPDDVKPQMNVVSQDPNDVIYISDNEDKVTVVDCETKKEPTSPTTSIIKPKVVLRPSNTDANITYTSSSIKNESEILKKLFSKYYATRNGSSQTFVPNNSNVIYTQSNLIVLENLFPELSVYKIPVTLTVSDKIKATIEPVKPQQKKNNLFDWSTIRKREQRPTVVRPIAPKNPNPAAVPNATVPQSLPGNSSTVTNFMPSAQQPINLNQLIAQRQAFSLPNNTTLTPVTTIRNVITRPLFTIPNVAPMNQQQIQNYRQFNNSPTRQSPQANYVTHQTNINPGTSTILNGTSNLTGYKLIRPKIQVKDVNQLK